MPVLPRPRDPSRNLPSSPSEERALRTRRRMRREARPAPIQLPLFPEHAELVSIRPERNERRYYRIEVTTDLFGAVGLLRCWGRIGRSSRSRFDPAPDLGTALDRLTALTRAKRRRGYQDRFAPK